MKMKSNLNFWSYLKELRTRLIMVLLFTLILFFVLWGLRDDVLTFLTGPLHDVIKDTGASIIFLSLTDKFFLHLKTIFLVSVILSIPFCLYQVWEFIVPALYPTEKKYSFFFVFLSLIFFSTGLVVAYMLVLPVAFEFLINYSTSSTNYLLNPIVAPSMQIDWRTHIAFTLNLLFVFGFVFELPLLMMFLSQLGILEVSFFRKYRKHMIVVSMIIAAILTPPDPVTMIILSIPMILLYEIGIWGSVILKKAKRKKELLEVNS